MRRESIVDRYFSCCSVLQELVESDPTNLQEGRQEGIVTDITKDKSVMPFMAVRKQTLDWSVANPVGVFGDNESGRLAHIATVPIVAL